MSGDINNNKGRLWEWVKAMSTLLVVGVVSYKVYLTPIELTVDFPALLSLLLALFAVALAALFYFKATETFLNLSPKPLSIFTKSSRRNEKEDRK